MQDDRTYSEQIAKRVLSRAIELDHVRGLSYTHDELRSIAAEVGVSDAAFDQALHELVPVIPAQQISQRRRAGWAVPALAGAAVGAAAGIVDVTTYFVASPLAMGILLMFSGGMAALTDYRPLGRGFVSFQLKNGILWLLYAGTWTLTAASAGAGPIAEVVLGRTAALGWVVSSAFGTLMAAVHVWRKGSASPDVPSPAIPLRRRVAEKLKRLIDLWAERVSVAPDHIPDPQR